VDLLEGSIADERILASLDPGIDCVYHLATYHGNQSSIHDPLADHANNLITTLRLFDHLTRVSRSPRIVYASAGCTVAEKTKSEARATAESDTVSLHHDSPYQISKLVGEMYASFYWRQHGLPVVRARFQNVYGPGEVLGAGEWRGTSATVWRNVVPTFVYRAVKGLPLVVTGQDATRDFVYVSDVVQGLLRCAAHGQPGEAYNLASGVETPILGLARRINALAGNRSKVEVHAYRAWDHSGRRLGSTEKARAALGFSCRVGIEQGLELTYAWSLANMRRIEACIARHGDRMATLA
jgi:nucleoside-diphosphate-sugar epimerase